MDITTFIVLSLIGLIAGVAGGYVGIGGGIIIVPALIYFIGLEQHQAQGVSIAMMLPPIGILAFMSYYQSGAFNLENISETENNRLLYYALIMAFFFVCGGWIGAKWSLKTPVHIVKLVFGSVMLYAAIKMILNGLNHYLK
tara:strand:- start:6579 stop:7001 length:423 start_codon:yes stop_codon:yes gene_type:complete